MDQRDARTWITLELTPLGEEKVQDGTLAKTLRGELGVAEDFPIFVPATSYIKNGNPVTVLLMEGYAFVASGLEDTDYFRLEKKSHVAKVLSSNEGGSWKLRVPMTVPNSKILDLQRQLQEQASVGVSMGETVRVLHGRYRNLDGIVKDIQGDNASVEIKLRSLEIIANIPRAFLEIYSPNAEISPE